MRGQFIGGLWLDGLMGRNAPSPQMHKVGAHQIRIEIVNFLVRQGADIIPLLMMVHHDELADERVHVLMM